LLANSSEKVMVQGLTASTTDDPVVRLEDVGVSFGGVAALTGVSAAVRPGEIVAVVGPNGAGKTTLLNAISGLLRGSITGRVAVAGTDTTKLKPQAVARLGVGRSFQEPRLIDDESALENVLCGAHSQASAGPFAQVFRPLLARRDERAMRERAMAIMLRLGLEEVAPLRVADLSYGHRKLIDIGRAMMSVPDVLLLDEPTSGLDEHEQQAVVEILRAVNAAHPRLSMILVEHRMPMVSAVATRIIAMQTGSVLLDDAPDTVMNSAAFKAALVGRSVTDNAASEEPS
jgi:branched-chain amino acid transport system ATP-binding protein